MAVIAAPQIPTAPNEPNKGAAVLVLALAPPSVLVVTRPVLPAPSVGASINLSGGQAV
jgi:hypothetical protein